MSTDFAKMTVKELKSYAKNNDIDLKNATKKSEIVAVINGISAKISEGEKADGVIQAPSVAKITKISNATTNEDGAIVVRSAETYTKKNIVEKETKKDVSEKVALWSEGNLHWVGVGHISKGYNIVTKEASEKWLTRRSIRLATPEEVATYYGK